MKIFTCSEAQLNLASMLEQARKEGVIGIRDRSGRLFTLRPEQPTGSPLDVEGLDLGLTKEEIVAFIREGRREL
jgi:hypothetical protein